VIAALVLTPLALAALALALPDNRLRPWVIPLSAAAHAALTALALAAAPPAGPGAWLGLDPLARLVLAQVSALYLLCALYLPAYLDQRADRDNRVFTAALTALLGTLSLAILARHVGLMWVALESSTLAAAPLLYFNRNRRSIEATWKYLVIGGVGLAVALLGSFFLAYSALHGGLSPSLFFDDLARSAPSLSRPWLHAALALLFVGYGTKMGLAPMHTWKPDAYGEAAGAVGALFAGGFTSVAFLAVLRVHRLALLAGEGDYARHLLTALGLASMAVAGVFLMRQDDIKRTLAYSSVEHMGILAIGVALGGPGLFGALYHMVNNAFAKGVMFLAAGNLHRALGTKRASQLGGARGVAPWSTGLFLAGFFAVTGAPPFAPFFSEWSILQTAVDQGAAALAVAFALLLLLAFVGMGLTVLRVAQGTAAGPPPQPVVAERARTLWPIAALLALSLLLGALLPAPVRELLLQASAYVEGR
jgi:hydrogenase-4 component F